MSPGLVPHPQTNVRRFLGEISRHRTLPWLIAAVAGATLDTHGGGSGLNTVVVVNQASSNSCALGNYYCERRQVPPENLLRITWTGGNVAWSSLDFEATLRTPLLAMLAARGLSNQVDYVVLSMDIPIQTINGQEINSTTSALFYGLKDDSGPDSRGVTNSYAGSEGNFREAAPASAPGYAFLTTMITADTLAQAVNVVDQGAASDGTFPGRRVLLMKSSDPTRNIRYHWFDDAVFNTRLGWNYPVQQTNANSFWGQTNLLGLQTGLAQFTISPNTFGPGAMADSVTSYGGLIFGPNGQTTLLAFIGAGASGSYGTVTEPTPNPDKFPDPQNYFYQARGFSLAECYYQSLVAPYQGLIVGEPLAAPCRRLGQGNWIGISSNAVLSGTAPLAAQFRAADGEHPLRQVDLFVDGKFQRTLTNLLPAAGNVLTIALNGYPVSYTIPTNATIASVTAGLADSLNTPANINLTKVAAFAHGDRIELRATATNRLAASFYFTDAPATNTLQRYYRVVYLNEPKPVLTPQGFDPASGFHLTINCPAGTPFVVQASTNLADWTAVLANPLGGSTDFVDASATNLSRRFYRVLASFPAPRPTLSPLGRTAGGGFRIHAGAANSAFVLQASTNLAVWTSLATNLTGAPLDYEDTGAANFPHRFYRALVLPPPPPPRATLTLLSPPGVGPARLRVDGATQPYRIEVSTDLRNWTPVFTNLAIGVVVAGATQSAGSAAGLSTFLTARRNTFLDSAARGIRSANVNGTLQTGTFLQLSVTKTSGAQVVLTATSASSSTTPVELTQMLVNAINSSPDLQGADGLTAEDLTTDWFGSANFNLLARSGGLEAAAIRVRLTGSESLVFGPETETRLDENLGDLQPRNHLYVTAGLTNLAVNSALNTSAMEEGFHELAAVAYEGSHVRTQTRLTLPITVTNSPLSASLTRLDLADTAPVQSVFHLQITANTHRVTALRLFSTGGELGVITNQFSGVFTVNGTYLGAGLHPFYGIIETSDGRKFRTQKQTVRLVSGP